MLRKFATVLVLLGATYALAAQVPGIAEARQAHRGYAAYRHTSRYWSRLHSHKSTGNRSWRVAAQSPSDSSVQNRAGATPQPPHRPARLLTRDEILGSDPDRLERLGRRLIVGFQNLDDARKLVEKRAVSGLFITDLNVRGHKVADIARDIQSLQDIRRAQALPRLIIAADQEGGYVSRLSPPLKWQPSLAMLIAPLATDAERETAVRTYAETQARELDSIGITMNLGPVVDLRLSGEDRDDGETQLYWRAIDGDPYVVAKIAGWYCDTLTRLNIICTLKHFPGLARVHRDTHVAAGEIMASEAQLQLSDWLPFRRLIGRPGIATMIGHVRIDEIDRATPASYSASVVNGLVRTRWDNDALLITDDFSMGAITNSSEGIAGATIKALNAGVDLVLLSSSERYFDTVMSALLEADANGEIDGGRESQSHERLSRYVFIDDRPPAQTAEERR